MSARPLVAALLLALACHHEQVQAIAPAVVLDPTALDFGAVRVDTPATLRVTVQAASKANLDVQAEVTGDGFALSAGPDHVAGLSSGDVAIAFTPNAPTVFSGELVLTTNDPMHPSLHVPLFGHGAYGALAVTTACDVTARCEATVMNGPPSIQFAPEPYIRLVPVDPRALPALVLHSTGEVPVVLGRLSLEGLDLASFSFVGNATVPDGGLSLAPDASVTLPLRFTPVSATQAAYLANAHIQSDDPSRPDVRVPLSGALRPNLPPTVCLNLVNVLPADGTLARHYSAAADWQPLLTVPDGGYDFTASRDVPPRAELQISALSDPNDEGTCTFDPDDGRLGLKWEWQLLSSPPGSSPIALAGASTPTVSLRVFAVGRYVVQLTVSDIEGNSTSATAAFTVALKSDLLVQLEWAGGAGVDLDLHLVRPDAGPFSPGDLNGYALTASPDASGDFDWGAPGPLDDPHLNVDDTGSGPLLENISLDRPDDDPACASSPCVYQVLVHEFADGRPHAGAPRCAVDAGPGCKDGQACGCSAPALCVADAAPKGMPATGPGTCLQPVNPVVRLFFRGASSPSQQIPLPTLMPPDALDLAAPCQLLHVADVVWPARGSDAGIGVIVPGVDVTGRVVSPQLFRYGLRQAGNLQCAPDTTRAGKPWYGLEP